MKKYKLVRMRDEDYQKILAKKRDMEFDLKQIIGKTRRIPDIRLFGVIANSSWELPDYKNQLLDAANHKRRTRFR